MAKWNVTLSTTEPFNHVGLIKVRQNNIQSEEFEIKIIENSKPKDLTNLEVFFNTRFGKNSVQERVTIIDAKNGVVRYALSDYAMQQATKGNSLQMAYVEFRTKEGDYVGSTQYFKYYILSSIYRECTESGTYIIRLEELLKYIEDYFNGQSQNWEQWIEDNREIIESIDPNGTLLTEVIEARESSFQGFPRLKDRLDYTDSLVNDRVKKSDLSFNSIDDSLPQINTKIIKKTDDNTYEIITRQPSSDKYVKMIFKKNNGDSSESSVGQNFELIRLTNVHSLESVCVFNQPGNFYSSSNNGINDFQLSEFQTNFPHPTYQQFITNNSRSNSIQNITFSVNIKPEMNGRLQLGFLGTNASDGSASIFVNGIKTDVISTKRKELGIICVNANIGSFLGDCDLKIETSENGICHFLGFNCGELNSLSKSNFTDYLYKFNAGKHYISNTSGANEYALKLKNGKWFGSFHGGEISTRAEFHLDGVKTELELNKVYSFSKLELIQETQLIEKITSQNITKIQSDGTYEFDCYFEVSESVELTDFYTGMSCVNDNFNEIISPRFSTVSDTNSIVHLPNNKKVKQLNASTGQTVTTYYSPAKEYATDTPLRVLYFKDLYSKVYHGVTTGNLLTLENINFSNKKVFD